MHQKEKSHFSADFPSFSLLYKQATPAYESVVVTASYGEIKDNKFNTVTTATQTYSFVNGAGRTPFAFDIAQEGKKNKIS